MSQLVTMPESFANGRQPEDRISKKRPKILIVDDRPENLVAIETVLRHLDIELIKANSGNEALKATLHHHFALALLDIQMPGMDGYELAGILREEEKTCRLPFIFISAVYTDNFDVFKGYEKGAFSFITKPFQPEILINKVKFFIEKHLQEIALYELNESLALKNSDLEQINGELESFSYSISHDLMVPLRALNAYSKMLEEGYGHLLQDIEAKRLLYGIQTNAQKMGTLIEDLLEFSRLGRQDIKKAEVNMADMVEGILQELSLSMPHKAHIIVGAILPAQADRSLIQQVWMNLLTNAIKYSARKENPQIEIASLCGEEEVTYFVKDNGAGFNMNYAHKLFGVFQRLHSPKDFDGTGIGLAIAQRIVDKHKGKIWAEGEMDKGATFYFSLPIK